MDSRRTLIVYRDELLGASETFIRAQGESLDRFEAFYLGLRRLSGLSLPAERFHIVSGSGIFGKLKRVRFKCIGPSSSLLHRLAAMQPELVHAHFATDATNAISLARRLGIPLVVTLHGYDVTTSNQFLPRLSVHRQNQLKQCAAKFLCVSEFIRERALARGFPALKTVVHYTGIDTDFFDPQTVISRSRTVLFVGRLVSKKGCEFLLRAMQRVQEISREADLVIIGDGPLRSELEKQAAATLKNYQFLGVQPPSVVKDWMNRASVFCTPSVTAASGDAEGFGMVFAEAQAMGLPVVSFMSGGIPEIVTNERTGFLVPERNWQSLAAKLLILLTDRDVWLRFSEAGRAQVKSKFDIWKQASSLENIYESVLAHPKYTQAKQTPVFRHTCSPKPSAPARMD